MNTFIQIQINYMVSSVEAFMRSCKLAATKDDGIVSKEERRILRKINRASNRYNRQLNRILKRQTKT